ncbi:MAG: hypothetical protein F6K19_50070 [Cyanothece sp. SIO1E1]|nr:hypothetical protein [Cyanothece sp. SIO1E1]
MLIQDNRTVREIPAQEVSAGVYVATLNVQSNDTLNEGILVGRLEQQSQTTYDAATEPVLFSTAAAGSVGVPTTSSSGTTSLASPETIDLQPRFTSHQNGDQVSGNSFTLIGQTRPNAVVQVNVDARTGVLGGLINLNSNTLIDQAVTADSSGRFQIEVPTSGSLVGGTRYEVSATARFGNEASESTTISLTRR